MCKILYMERLYTDFITNRVEVQGMIILNASHPAHDFHAREKKQRVTEIQTWLDEYDVFVREYTLGKDDMSIGTAWKEIAQLESWDRIKELADAFMILRDGIIPYAKYAILVWYKTNDPELNYHNLDQVHNGLEASTAFADMANHTPEEIEELRANLLKYCGLDTYAMVKVLGKLKEVVK